MMARLVAAVACALALWAQPAAAVASDAGEAIYRQGIGTGGVQIDGRRDEGARLKGAAAACINCHQRSGLGGREGRSAVPPITGRYLYRARSAENGADIHFVNGMRGDREPYTDATLARAIREGVDTQGRRLSYLMPRYALKDADMAALIRYLKAMDARKVPGVTDSTLHFATIITPDADPVKKRGMLEVMKQFFADRNVRQMVVSPTMRTSAKTSYAKSMFMVHRRWELHVWELTGPESTWQQQLQERLEAEPVFAVVSGLGGHHWGPVHEFCERAALPCLFPNVEVPVDHETDFYSLYFSKGVLLEAQLVAEALSRGGAANAPASVLQVYREGDSGEEAAAALTAALKRQGVPVTERLVPAGEGAAGVNEALRGTGANQAVVLWLRPADLAALQEPAQWPREVYLSGLMGGLEGAPLPLSWRSHAHMAYPFDLPERRRVRVDFALGWFAARRIPLLDEQVQVDTWLALGLVSETLGHMTDTFVREYLVERAEAGLEHRIVTGYYPRLALATRQRFASKGGYLVSLSSSSNRRVLPDGDWTVP
jgi:cytochrome c553